MTDDQDASPPPVFKNKDLDHVILSQFAMGFVPIDYEGLPDSTAMLIAWRLLRVRTPAKTAKLMALSKERVVKLANCFDDNATADLKDWASELGEY